MHLNKILEQIKRHQSPSEAIDKLSTALEKHEGSLLEKGFTILKSELAANMYEAINGPHFDEEHARYAVEGMENEDGTKGPHWTVEETTSVANQMGINLKSEKHNKWDWYVAMNMIYSDYYKAVVAMTGSANTKHFAELAKAWLCDKDMTFSQLTSGTRIHVLEITGTFKKSTMYSLGTVVSVSKPYDEPVPPTQFPMPMQNRRKLVDLVISCDGEQRKLSVSEDKTMMTDSSIGLTIATEKSQIVNMVRQSLEDCRVKKESLSKIDEEMRRCEDILKILNVNSDITTNVTKDFKELDELRAEVKELKQLLQNISTVRPEENNIDPPTEEKENEI